MADDKTKTDARDRFRVAGGQEYEVQFLTEKTGITREQARELIERLGNDREMLEQAATSLKRAG